MAATLGVLVSLLTLELSVAAVVGGLLAVFGWLGDRAIYKMTATTVRWPLALGYEEHWLGSTWFVEDDGLTFGFALVYDSKRAAAEAYRSFRAWLTGRFHDAEGEIRLRVILEQDMRASIFLYPSPVSPKMLAFEHATRSLAPANTFVHHDVAVPFTQITADYSDRPHVLDRLGRLSEQEYLPLNAAYIDGNGRPQTHAKKEIRLTDFTVQDRSEVDPRSLEGQLSWADATHCDPDRVARFEAAKSGLPDDVLFKPRSAS